MPIIIRKATEDDIPRILEIADAAISPSWTHGSVQDGINRDDALLLVAVDFDVVGFAAARQVGGDGELLQIAVDAKNRRCGVGTRLMNAMLGFAKENALASAFLEVRVSNAAAIAMYKKLGFTQVRVRKGYYTAPAEDAAVMAKELSRQT